MYSLNDMVALRREIHSFPEPGWCEFVTTSKIVERLKSYGCRTAGRQTNHQPRIHCGQKSCCSSSRTYCRCSS